MTVKPKRGRGRLRVASPAEIPDTRAEVARTLLGPVHPVLDNLASGIFGFDYAAHRKLDELHCDPRHLIGRLSQALTALLEQDVPPIDATAQPLSDAITDAIEYRLSRAAVCQCGDSCERCLPDGRKAELYEGLYGALGIIAEKPPPRPELKTVDS